MCAATFNCVIGSAKMRPTGICGVAHAAWKIPWNADIGYSRPGRHMVLPQWYTLIYYINSLCRECLCWSKRSSFNAARWPSVSVSLFRSLVAPSTSSYFILVPGGLINVRLWPKGKTPLVTCCSLRQAAIVAKCYYHHRCFCSWT